MPVNRQELLTNKVVTCCRPQILAVAVAACCMVAGCGPTEPQLPVSDGHGAGGPNSHEAHGDHDHGDHDHGDHDHDDHAGHNHAEMGIHGGHVVVLDPGHVHAEWVHDDANNVLEVYVLDNPETVTAVRVITTIKDQEPKTTELAKDETLGSNGYAATSPNLLTDIQMADGEAIRVTLQVETANGVIAADLSDDHDH